MKTKPSSETLFTEGLSIVAAFGFVIGLLVSSPALMAAAAFFALARLSLHVVSFARPVTPHFRKQRSR